MRHHHGVLDVVAAGLLPAAVREEVDVPDGLEQAEPVGKVRAPVRVYDVDEPGVRGVELSRLLAEQVVPEERRGRIQAGDPAEQETPALEHLRGAAGHVGAEAEADEVHVPGLDAEVHRVQEDQAELPADELGVGDREAVGRAGALCPVHQDDVGVFLRGGSRGVRWVFFGSY